MPGHGTFPVGGIREDQLKLLGQNSDGSSQAPTLRLSTQEPANAAEAANGPGTPVPKAVPPVVETRSPKEGVVRSGSGVEEASPTATTVPGDISNLKNNQRNSDTVLAVPEAASISQSPPSPSLAPSSSVSTANPSKKYDKYRDGTYWKRLG